MMHKEPKVKIELYQALALLVAATILLTSGITLIRKQIGMDITLLGASVVIGALGYLWVCYDSFELK